MLQASTSRLRSQEALVNSCLKFAGISLYKYDKLHSYINGIHYYQEKKNHELVLW
jgi:hypothetical protein